MLAKDSVTVGVVLARYFTDVVPLARRELSAWKLAAAEIPDRGLREHAQATLGGEALLAEAAALFAAMVAPPYRAAVARATIAFQVLYDYLDTLGEQDGRRPLEAGRRLYALLDGAFEVGDGMDDGGYVDALATACRTALASLPAMLVALPGLLRAARRCASGQTRTHAVAEVGSDQLAAWSHAQAGTGECEWWEVAGGAISSLGVHALIAAAADPRLTSEDVDAVDRAYFPWICALSTLLDCVIDRHGPDVETDNHSVLAYYVDERVAAARVAAIAAQSLRAARALRSGAHVVIVLGVVAWYLSSAEARRPANVLIAATVRRAVGPLIMPLLLVLRLRRLVG